MRPTSDSPPHGIALAALLALPVWAGVGYGLARALGWTS